MNRLKSSVLWGYGFGNLGYGLTSQIQATYLVFYATVVLGMSGASIGLLVSIGVIWDAFSDPIMGYFSDHTRSKRFGRRHLYLAIGGIGVTVIHLLLWNIPFDWSARSKWFLMVFYVLAIKTFTTVYITPYTALAAEISDDYTDRTRIQAVKTAWFLIGIFLATAFGMALFFRATPEFPIGQTNPAGYRNIAIFGSTLMLISAAITYATTSPLIDSLNARILSNETPSFKAFFKEIFFALDNQSFRSVVMGYLLTNISTALISTLALHVYTYTYGMTNFGIAAVVGIQLLMSIVSQPFWIRYSHKKEKKKAVQMGIKIAGVAILYFLLTIPFRSLGFVLLMPFGALAGFGTGGLFTLPQAMVADAVDENALHIGKRQEGVFYGTLTLSYKLSQSLAIFLLGFALDFLRFDANKAVQTPFTLNGLALLLGLGCLISFGLSYLAYKPYALSKARMSAIHEELSNKS